MAWDWWGQLDRIEAKLDHITFALRKSQQREEQLMASLDELLTQVEEAAEEESNAQKAAMALLTSLAQMVANLKAGGGDPATLARIQALSDKLKERAAALAAAVVAGTPAA